MEMYNMDRYFDKFPIITYANNISVDIIRRSKVLEKYYSNPYVFYTYDISHKERPDQFSARYYDDAYKSWLVYLSNKIIDPYYEWYLQDNEFYENLANKYGSVYNAQTKVKYYRNSWEGVENLSISAYNALDYDLKKYWTPHYDEFGNILNYERLKTDWIMNTNKIFSYAISNSNFITNEICDIVFDISNTGKGQVVKKSNTHVYLQHLYGTYETSNTVSIVPSSYIYGTESNVNTVFTTATCVANNIKSEEEVYWTPVTFFQYEEEKNEYNKTIKVMDNNLTTQIVNELYDLMRK
jgi:hypothetical protein